MKSHPVLMNNNITKTTNMLALPGKRCFKDSVLTGQTKIIFKSFSKLLKGK